MTRPFAVNQSLLKVRSVCLFAVGMLLMPNAASAQPPVSFKAPHKVDVANDGLVNVYVKFQVVKTPGFTVQGTPATNRIWTRSYAFGKTAQTARAFLPGKTFVFKPGDLLQIELNDQLNVSTSEALRSFEQNVDTSFDTDEILEGVHHEINIPHNANNTNLHVHGLHVDPTIDDVELILIPRDESPADYNDRLQSKMPGWNPKTKKGEYWRWGYRYRVPRLHLPGTHWYHAHKHGSTAIHVENGMAGAFVINPLNDPKYPLSRPVVRQGNTASHRDDVVIMQEITNFGQQQGRARGPVIPEDNDTLGAASAGTGKTAKHGNSTDITVNGIHQPTVKLKSGELQRLRLVNASANHKSFSHIWLGKNTGRTIVTGTTLQTVYQQVLAYVVAVDGITMSAKVPISADNPLLMGPGNRADVMIQLTNNGDTDAQYTLFKNYPTNVLISSDSTGLNLITPKASTAAAANPYLFPQKVAANPNYSNFKVNWLNLNNDGTQQSITLATNSGAPAMTPIITAKSMKPKKDGTVLLDVQHATTFGKNPAVGWQTVAGAELGGGGTIGTPLMNIVVTREQAENSAPMPDDVYLASISPTGNPTKAPAYVSPVTDKDILQSRTAVFDISGIDVFVCDDDGKPCANVIAPKKGQANLLQRMRQFTLNGRQFSMIDSIGNPDAPKLVQNAASLDEEGAVTDEKDKGEQGQAVDVALNYVEHAGLWDNRGSGTGYWVNPGYYTGLKSVTVNGVTGWGYDIGKGDKPDFKSITGIPKNRVAVVNPSWGTTPANVPGVPVATTAEEWVLINNSNVGHPFHIHINPFFVTEIGQLDYSAASKGKEFSLTKITFKNGKRVDENGNTSTNPMAWMTGNWWDTIIIPAHGYVKFRYWMNVPQQSPEPPNGTGKQYTVAADKITIKDNVNRIGTWVYHCHILRHEDRGMMMAVQTQPLVMQKKQKVAAADGNQSDSVADVKDAPKRPRLIRKRGRRNRRDE